MCKLGQYDMDLILKMLSLEVLGSDVKLCRMIMLSLNLENAWCLYAFDMLKKRVNILDPVYTL